MRTALQIYDVSGFVHCAQNVSDYASRYSHNFPVGGIQYLMKFIVSDLMAYKDVVLCFDRGRSFRKDIDKRYKAGRIGNKDVWAQLDLLYDLLPQCGLVCHGRDSFEADDLIYNVVEANDGPYDYQEIEILGTDYDLTHNITDGHIRFHSMSSQVNCVTWYDFSTAMFKDKVILPNTIAAYKIFCGDNSDRIPAFTSKASGITGSQFYGKYKELIKKQSGKLSIKQIRSEQLLRVYLKQLGEVLNNQDMEELDRRIRLVYPVKLDDKNNEFKEYSNSKNINMTALTDFLRVVNDRTSLKTLKKYYATPPESLIKTVKARGKALITGEYAVDNNRPLDMSVNSEVVNLKSFS